MADFPQTPNIGLAYMGDAVLNADLNRIDSEIGALKAASSGPAGQDKFLPPGGTTGQVLQKRSDADYDCIWVTLP